MQNSGERDSGESRSIIHVTFCLRTSDVLSHKSGFLLI